MKLRSRLEDNYDPDYPWIVEIDTPIVNDTLNGIEDWINKNATGRVQYWIRKVGFANHEDALMFYLTFS